MGQKEGGGEYTHTCTTVVKSNALRLRLALTLLISTSMSTQWLAIFRLSFQEELGELLVWESSWSQSFIFRRRQLKHDR